MVLDNACGTGVFTGELLKLCPHAQIHAVDGSSAMVDIMYSLIQDKKWSEQVQAAVMDGQDLGFPDDIFDISVTNFGIFFLPDPSKGPREILRTLKSSGVAVVTCWKELGFYPVLYEAQSIIQPISPVRGSTLDEWQHKERLEKTMVHAGFRNVKMESKEVVLWGQGLAGLVRSLVGIFNSIVGSQWNEEEKAKLDRVTERVLTEGRRIFCVEGEGSDVGKVGVRMVAWIAIGKKCE